MRGTPLDLALLPDRLTHIYPSTRELFQALHDTYGDQSPEITALAEFRNYAFPFWGGPGQQTVAAAVTELKIKIINWAHRGNWNNLDKTTKFWSKIPPWIKRGGFNSAGINRTWRSDDFDSACTAVLIQAQHLDMDRATLPPQRLSPPRVQQQQRKNQFPQQQGNQAEGRFAGHQEHQRPQERTR